MVPAWNTVGREARGKYFLFCSDDDVLVGDAIGKQVELLEAHPNVGFCHADWAMIDDDDTIIGYHAARRRYFVDRGLLAWPKYLVRTGCRMQTAVTRRDLWERVGGWDEDAGNPGDNSLFLKLLRISDVGHVPFTTCHFRVRTKHPDSWSKYFLALDEYHSLGIKYLADPPPGIGVSATRLRHRLVARLAREGILLFASAQTPNDVDRISSWLERNIWSELTLGAVLSLLARRNGLSILAAGIAAESQLKLTAKSVVVAAQKAINPRPRPI
jgi:hypothetical protein